MWMPTKSIRLLNLRVSYYLLVTHMATEAFLISLRCGADDPRREDGKLVSSTLLRCNSRIPVACSRYRRVIMLTRRYVLFFYYKCIL